MRLNPLLTAAPPHSPLTLSHSHTPHFSQYKRELEEARRWLVTPPEPPEGLDDDIMQMWRDVMSMLTSDQPRLCRLRKWGRSMLQVKGLRDGVGR